MAMKKVRIKVAIDETGFWHAAGWKGLPGIDARAMALQGLTDDSLVTRTYTVTALIPVPELDAGEVKGEVEDL